MKPKTLDLAANARLSLEFLGKDFDPACHDYPFYKTHYDTDPTYHRHCMWDYCENPGRNAYGIMFARHLVGPDAAGEAAEKMKNVMYRHFDENDGFNYRPAPENDLWKPYPEYPPQDVIPVYHEADLWDNRSVLMGLMTAALTEGDQKAADYARQMVEAFGRVSIRKGDEVYVAHKFIKPGYKASDDEPPHFGEALYGWITPLVRYYTHFGSQQALDLAQGVVNFFRRRAAVNEQGIPHQGMNVHGLLFALAGVLRCALVTGDKEAAAWAKGVFDKVVDWCGSSIGWVAEHQDDSKCEPGRYQSGETCATVDLIDTAIRLAQAGHPEYWNNVERYARNYFQEGQLRDVSWMPCSVKKERDHLTYYYDSVPEMIRGCYVGWGAPNDFVNPKARKSGHYAIMHCCGPHGAMGTYLVWNNIVTRDKSGVSVNLLINRDSPHAEVLSWSPHQGRLDVKMKVADKLRVRIPDWAEKDKVTVARNGEAKPAPVGPDGFVAVGEVPAGQTVSVRYPMRRIKRKESIYALRDARWEFSLEWRGDTVVSIDPAGKVNPFFNRSHLDTDEVELEDREFYYPEKELDW